jgi:ATP-dependent DNA helicase
MKLDQIRGPGVDTWLVEQLRSWGIESLTEIQELALSGGVADGQNMIVCAPTSSGKTVLGEVAVLCGLRAGRKGIYLVSHKALADQKYDDFRKRFGEDAQSPLGSVGLSTGDREEGDYEPALLVVTYEKALGLALSGQLELREVVVVADELQILGDLARGPNIEAFCAVLRQRGVSQFVALTATVENPDDLAGWLNSKLTISRKRDIPLHQEIWFQGKAYRVTFGQNEGQELNGSSNLPSDPLDAVDRLTALGRGPLLVFTETRREAIQLAGTYSKKRRRAADGIAIAEQLDLFSEPTEASQQLRENAERKVAFHTADLTPQERQVIEQGFVSSKFEVCFATSTLAAGVNFPFKSVLFPKLTYQYGTRAGTMIPRGEYRNMSGRAGRLSMHEDGYSILLPRNAIELRHANQLVLPENDAVVSQLLNLSMRRSVLTLIASGLIGNRGVIREFFEHTLYWYQVRERNPGKLEEIIRLADKAADWLIGVDMVEQHNGELLPTPLGKATSLSGLLPSTAASFVKLTSIHRASLEQEFENVLAGVLYWVCSSDEFLGDTPTRFLPYPLGTSPGSTAFLSGRKLLQPIDRTNSQLNQCVHGLVLYIDGLAERKIAHFTNVSAGSLHRLAIDVSWVLDGLHRLSCVPDLGLSQQAANRMAMLSRRVRWGSPAEALDVIRIAERHGVPGLGRQRAMALIQNGLATFEDILSSGREKLLGILRNERRVSALLNAVASAVGGGTDRLARTHLRVAKQLGLERLVEDCNTKVGTEYEIAIQKLLDAESSWVVRKLDDGKRQNVPDILVSLGSLSVLVECKTCRKQPQLINKEEAFAVLQKGTDFDKAIHRATLGKPAFDEHSKIKAQASLDITLVEHSVFMEGVLRVHAGSTTPHDFLTWLGTPGIAEIERLSGMPSYSAIGVQNRH